MQLGSSTANDTLVPPSSPYDGALDGAVSSRLDYATLPGVPKRPGQDDRGQALLIEVQEAAHLDEYIVESVTCPSRLNVCQGLGAVRSPGKSNIFTFDPFSKSEDAEGHTPLFRCSSSNQPVAPRKHIAVSPLTSHNGAKLLPGKPHSCPTRGLARKSHRPVVRVRVKRSLDLASGQHDTGDIHINGELQPMAGVRKRSELFSPPIPRKFSRSMEDVVAAGIINKLRLEEQQ